MNITGNLLIMDKTLNALKLAEEALSLPCDRWNKIQTMKVNEALAAISDSITTSLAAIREALAEPVKQEPVAHPFECWSTNDGDSWFEHPADAQLLYDVLGDDPKVGDEFEVSAGWNCVTATYRIASKDGDDFEVECISNPQNDSAPVQPVKQEPVAWTNYNGAVNNRLKGAPVDAKAIRAEALEEAAKVCEVVGQDKNYHGIAAAIRGLK